MLRFQFLNSRQDRLPQLRSNQFRQAPLIRTPSSLTLCPIFNSPQSPVPTVVVCPPNPIKSNRSQPRPKPVRTLELAYNLQHLKHTLLNNILREIPIDNNSVHVCIQPPTKTLGKSVQTLFTAKLRLPDQFDIIVAACHGLPIIVHLLLLLCAHIPPFVTVYSTRKTAILQYFPKIPSFTPPIPPTTPS